MADIRAFRGYRYDLGRVGALKDVVAPPYDVIDPAYQQALYDRSPHNVVRIDFAKESPADNENDNRYSRSSRTMRDWIGEGILRQDTARGLYVYHQEFEAEGHKYVRKGFLARLRLEEFGKGKVFPHEETFSGPKEDRFRLTTATGMNLSAVFGMYPDTDGAAQEALDKSVGRALPVEATDELGVVNRLWPVVDQQVVSTVTGLMGPKPVFIADGHHRYETALRYREECRKKGQIQDDESAANFVLMMLVRMNDPGLVILPTHRLVSGIPDLNSQQLHKLLGPHFDVEVVGQGPKGMNDAWETLQTDGGQNVLGFGTVADGTWQIARFRGQTRIAEWASNHSETWRGLAVSILHVVVLDRLLTDGHVKPQCKYVHTIAEVGGVVAAKQCQLATLVPPAKMDHVEKIAGNLEKMPQKSTYFYPKLLTGMVFNPLTAS